MRILAVDPGKASGICEFNEGIWNQTTTYQGSTGFWQWQAEHKLNLYDYIVVESFFMGQRGKHIESDAVDIIGSLKYLAFGHKIEQLVMQTPSVHGHISKEDLMELGLWARRTDHERVAAQHLIAFARRREIDLAIH